MTEPDPTELTDLPQWFSEAIATPCEHRDVSVAGANIHYRAWGPGDGQPVILIHGGAANSSWWDHVAPHLAAEYRVLAIDLSGHGDSDHRDEYTLLTWVDEVFTVAAAESDRKPILLGHSMGGFVALKAASVFGDRLSGAAAIDSPVRALTPETEERVRDRGANFALKIYSEAETMIGRFRTMPAEEGQLEYVLRHVAAQSIVEVEGGWQWKFDPRVLLTAQMSPEELRESACPLSLIRGERGMATSDITDDVRSRLGGAVPITVVLEGAHHLMLDQPTALIAILQTLIGQWRTP